MENIETIRAYMYIITTAILVFVLYGYVWHLYTSKKKGGKDYEQYGNMALKDEIDDKPIDPLNKKD
jgi:cytochrome c oxidase cbb3-type subunit IV